MSSNGNGNGSPAKKRRLNEKDGSEVQASECDVKLPKSNVELASKAPLLHEVGADAKQQKANTTTTAAAQDTQDNTASPTNTTVYIGGLHPVVQQAHLEKLLGKYGTIERLDLVERKKCCFCQFSSANEAQAAILSLNGRMLLKRVLKVQPAKQQSFRSLAGVSLTTTTRHATSHKVTSLDDRIQALKRKLHEKERGT